MIARYFCVASRVLISTCMLACTLAGCAPATRPAHPKAAELDPGPILPPAALDFDFQWRQRVTASWPTGKRSFDAVLQKRAGELVLLGLSPIGQPGFVVHLAANSAISLENHTGQALPFRAEYILADVERVFFPWLAAVPAAFSGERRGQLGVLQIFERYNAGQLVERSFERSDAPARGEVRIVYEPRRAGEDAARNVRVDNHWFDYQLSIETSEQSRLAR
jgi:hypothetical protein